MDDVNIVLPGEELKPLHVPGDMAGISHDLEIFHRGNQTPRMLLKISFIGER
jgi:hypothetical protein